MGGGDLTDWTGESGFGCIVRIIEIFNQYLESGGEEAGVETITRHLREGGHEVTRFWKASREWQGAGALSRMKQPFLMWRNPGVLGELRGVHERIRPDAWICHNVVPVISLGVYRLALELDVPILQWLHNYRPLSPGGALAAGSRLLQPEDRWIHWKESISGSWRNPLLTTWLCLGYWRLRRRNDFAAVRAWVAISEEMRRQFLRAGYPARSLYAMRYAYDGRDKRERAEDGGYFLFLGRMLESKGVRFLVDLFQRPRLRHLELRLGGVGPLYEELRNQTPANIKWLGYVEGSAKESALAGCRAVVFPSLWPEPLGLVTYEAYEYGKPVLGNRVGGLKETIQEGRTGFLLPSGDESAWEAAIVQVAENPDKARAFGANGLEWLLMEATGARWREKFDAMLADLGILAKPK